MEIGVVQCEVFSSDYRLETQLALFGQIPSVALNAIPESSMDRKRTRRERLMAAVTTKALFVPRLFVVKDTAFSQRFAALGTALSVHILIAVGTVELVFLWNKAAGPNGLFANRTFEALFMPVSPIVFETRASRFDRILTTFTRLLEVSDVAVITQYLVLVKGKFPL